MNLSKSKAICFLLFSVLFSVTGNAQFRNWDRFEIGGNYLLVNGEFNGVSSIYNSSGNFYIGDTTNKRSISTSMGVGVFIGSCIPFKRLGHESVWAISIGFMANQLTWSDINSVYLQNGSNTLAPNTVTGGVNGITLQFGLPFGIEYKVGTDAIKSMRSRTGASFGAGFMPLLNGTTVTTITANDEHGVGYNFGFNPYAKAEVAVFAGICIKLRAMFSYGKLKYMSETSNMGKYSDGPMSITGSTNLTISLILMPVSPWWTEHSWYNTYDTYNPYDKIH